MRTDIMSRCDCLVFLTLLSLQCSATWQVFIIIDSILICPGRTSLVLRNKYRLPPSSVTNPRTLFLVSRKPSFTVFVLLTLFSVMRCDLAISSVNFSQCSLFLFLFQPPAVSLHLLYGRSKVLSSYAYISILQMPQVFEHFFTVCRVHIIRFYTTQHSKQMSSPYMFLQV